MEKVAIVGAGLIGRSWAMVFARAGAPVALHDPVEGAAEAALAHCRQGLRSLAEHGLADDPDAAAARITIAPDLAAACAGAALVQENGPETLEAKRAIFAALDRHAAPGTILASSTSAIRASLFTGELAGRERCLVAHPVNPPHLVPVVELCGAPWTAPAAIERARALYAAAGQTPVTVLKEVDGFILNRLQAALLAEAFRLVADGVVSPADLDKTISDGLGHRWSFLGPFETIELNAPEGVADYCARYAPFFRRLAAESGGPDPWADDTIAAVIDAWGPPPSPADHAAKTRTRDERLAALAAHKKQTSKS